MVTNSSKKKHQQFGLKLLFIAVIVALVFTVWYLSEKRDRTGEVRKTTVVSTEAVPKTTENSRDMASVYLETTKELLNEGYDNVQLANDYSFNYYKADGSVEVYKTPDDFWRNFYGLRSDLNEKGISYTVVGNEVRALFTTKSGKTFLALITFADNGEEGLSTNKPILWQEALIPVSD